jgi:hypothetical protein
MFLPARLERQNTKPKGNMFYSSRKVLVMYFNTSCSCGIYVHFPAGKGKFPYRANTIKNIYIIYSETHHSVLDMSCHDDISKY